MDRGNDTAEQTVMNLEKTTKMTPPLVDKKKETRLYIIIAPGSKVFIPTFCDKSRLTKPDEASLQGNWQEKAGRQGTLSTMLTYKEPGPTKVDPQGSWPYEVGFQITGMTRWFYKEPDPTRWTHKEPGPTRWTNKEPSPTRWTHKEPGPTS